MGHCEIRVAGFVAFLLTTAASARADNFWLPLGGPTGGVIETIARDPATGAIYVGTSYQHGYNKFAGSVFKSVDNGDHWTYVSASFFTQVNPTATRVRALAVNSSGHVFAGLEAGVMRSTNGGASWSLINSGLPDLRIRALLCTATGAMYAATESNGIFSFNSGTNTWSDYNTGLTSLDTRTILVRMNDTLVGTQTGGVFKRVGAGAWAAASSGLTSLRVNHLDVSPFTGMLFASTDMGVFSSVDGAGSWQPVSGPFSGSVCWTVLDTGSNVLVGTMNGSYRAASVAGPWTTANSGFTGTAARGYLNDGAGRIFIASSDDGLFRSTNGGQDWFAVNNGIYGHTVVRLVVSSTGYIQAGTNANGIYRATVDGGAWEGARLHGWHMFALAESPWGELFAGNYNITNGLSDGHAWRSSDNGDTWSPLDNGIVAAMVSGFAFPANQQVYCSTAWSPGGISFSSTNGNQWSRVGPPQSIPAYCLTRNTQGNLFFGTEGLNVWRFNAVGQTWSNLGLSQSQQFSIAINSQGHVFVGNDGNIKGVYKSTANGDGLAPLGNFPGNYGYVICILPNDDLYVGTRDNGIQYSHDGGASWTTVNSGIPVTSCQAMTLGPDGYLYAGVAGFGVYRSASPVVAVVSGDIDGDGDVDDTDTGLFVTILVGGSATPLSCLRADVNHDGRADGADIRWFMNARLGG